MEGRKKGGGPVLHIGHFIFRFAGEAGYWAQYGFRFMPPCIRGLRTGFPGFPGIPVPGFPPEKPPSGPSSPVEPNRPVTISRGFSWGSDWLEGAFLAGFCHSKKIISRGKDFLIGDNFQWTGSVAHWWINIFANCKFYSLKIWK